MSNALQANVTALAQAMGTDIGTINALLNGVGTDLDTTAKTVIAAINENRAAIGNTTQIDDAAESTTTVWSSTKTKVQILAEIATALEGEDLSDLAAQVTANAAADANLVSADAPQTFTAGQKLQARQNIDAASSTEVATAQSDATQAISDAAAAQSTANTASTAAATADTKAVNAQASAAAAQSTATAAASAAAAAQATADANVGVTHDFQLEYETARDAV